ncbi:MAG: DUF4345 domain-containing protein [Bacteroidota bacterium]
MITKRLTQVFLGLMALAFAKVGIEALINPQAVLAQVGIVLDNPSAASSMRAVYGGMHLVFGIYCLVGTFKNSRGPLELIVLYTAGFIIGRVSGIIVDGTPNNFVQTWLVTESISFIAAASLITVRFRKQPVHTNQQVATQ